MKATDRFRRLRRRTRRRQSPLLHGRSGETKAVGKGLRRMQARLPATNRAGFFEIRMESIGGLGANLAGKMLAEAGVLKLGWNGTFSAAYGSEKKGTPVRASIRFADANHPIRGIYAVDEPHVVAVFHEALLQSQDCTAGLQPGGVLLVNTAKAPTEIVRRTGWRAGKVACVDATAIAVRERTRVNVAMLGALCRVMDGMPPEAVMAVIRETLGRKDAALVERNLRTFRAGYDEVRVEDMAPAAAEESGAATPATADRTTPVLGYRNQPQGGCIPEPGNSVWRDLSASRQGVLPILRLESCIHCAACDQVCPDLCFVWTAREGRNGRVFQFLAGIDYQYCKGCLKCVAACPTDALQAGREEDGYAEAHRTKHPFAFA